MDGIPQRLSLVAQTTAYLHRQISAGQWRHWLPPERALCETLQVSRSTLRRALSQLQREGHIRPEHGSGNRILTRRRTRRALHSHEVALLTPHPVEQLRPTQALWIDELRAMLTERGCRLDVFHGGQYFRSNPAAALDRLVRQRNHGCWVLALASAGCQQWFARHAVPCVIAGSCHAGIDLPFRDLDHRAMCRHAAGVLLAHGHRHLAFVAQKTRLAGDVESQAGFLEGVALSKQADARAMVWHHDATVDGIIQLLRRVLASQSAPTALLVANAYHYLTVATRLAQSGRRIPEDVSIISRDEDPFLSFVVPTPARYVVSPRALARSLLQPILELLENGAVSQRALQLMPEFVPGDTVAASPRPGA